MNIQNQSKFLNKGISTPIGILIIVIFAVLVGGILIWQFEWFREELKMPKPKIEIPKEVITDGIVPNIKIKPIGDVDFNYSVQALDVKGNYVYAGLLLDPFFRSNYGEFSIIDISNPSKPFVVGSIRIGNSVGSLKIKGNYAYIALSSGRGDIPDFLVIDISTPSKPKIVAQLNLGVFIDSMAISDSYVYLGVRGIGEKQNEIVIVDISNPLNPTIASKIWYSDIYNSIAIKSIIIVNNYAYVTLSSSNSNFLILDISDSPDSIKVINSLKLVEFPISDIKISGNFAYITLGRGYLPSDIDNGELKTIYPDNNFIVVDISNPLNPKIIKEIKVGADEIVLEVLYIDGNYIYAASDRGDDFRYKYQDLFVIDISNPLNPIQIKNLEIGDTIINSILVDKNYIYLGTSKDFILFNKSKTN